MVRDVLDDAEQNVRRGQERTRPTMAAQYEELRAIWHALQERRDIKPGMLVKFKKGASALSVSHDGLQVGWIVVRVLDPDNEIDHLIVSDRIRTSPVTHHGLGFDCIIATTSDNNSIMVMEMVHSSTLIPVSDEEAEAF
jgi:hypothetical protein